MRANSNWTGRTPRSCAEAFGPYQGSDECEIVAPRDADVEVSAADWALYFVAVLAILLVVYVI